MIKSVNKLYEAFITIYSYVNVTCIFKRNLKQLTEELSSVVLNILSATLCEFK